MIVFAQWLLLIIALTILTFLAIKGKDIGNKRALAIGSIVMVIFFAIDTYGTIGLDKSMNTITNIAIWITIIGLSSFFIFLKDIKRLAMVLYIPGVVIAFRLIQIVVPKINN